MSLARVPAWARELFCSARVARLGTADAQGKPLVMPICFVCEGELVYTAVDAKPKRSTRLRRVSNIEANEQVALLVDSWSENWLELCWVLAEGRATIAMGRDERERAGRLLAAKYPQYATGAVEALQGPLLRIEIATVRCWRSREP
jgi:PPOX class probable F420-dependent enzyme